jgi:tRNA(Ile)-lysidine synthase
MRNIDSLFYETSDPLERFKHAFLCVPSTVTRFWVAFSGGLDSSVLLHAAKKAFPHRILTAVYINHGLQAEATQWEEHCRAVCDRLQVPYVVHHVSKCLYQYRKARYSPEEAARKARYEVFVSILEGRDCLLTGHHLEDQAETFLLRLMRGAGVQGLGSMDLIRQHRHFYHLRPLLSWDRRERLSYARQYQLQWVEDSSNQDQRFTRNFIRHQIVPKLKQRWPAVDKILARTAIHCQEAKQLSEELACTDLKQCRPEQHKLSIQALLRLSLLRRRNALRYWLSHELNIPLTAIQFKHFEKILYNGGTLHCSLHSQSITFRRYQDYLYLLKQRDTQSPPQSIIWNTAQPVSLAGKGLLIATPRQGEGICASLLTESPVLEVRFRQGGERFHPHNRIGSHPLKKLFQEWVVPPWERYQWPLIYREGHIIAVPNFAVCQSVAAGPNELGLWIKFTRSTIM